MDQYMPLTTSTPNQPYVRIVEQPAKCALRFRYECEGRSAGSIPGSSATADNKTYPTIQVGNYRGQAVVVVSCVTKDQPYRPHPHNLVGKEGCKKGVCTMVINNSDMMCSFTSLGIQCVKRKDIEDSLKLRESIKVDPFRTGFNHKSQSSSIDLNVVRLCFQVFIEGPEKDKYTVQLPPIVSDPIYDKKAMTELIITKLSHCSAPCNGGKEVILLCDRVTKDDIQVRFYQEMNGQLVWDAFADLQPSDVHKQVAICFRTPRYFDDSITQPVSVQLQLRRPSDGCLSEPRGFQLLPREVDPDGLARKRQKIEEGCLERFLRENSIITGVSGSSGIGGSAIVKRNVIHVPRLAANIKLEPISASPVETQQQLQPNATTTTWTTHQFITLPPSQTPQPQQSFQQIRPQMDVLLSHDYRQPSQISSQASQPLKSSQTDFILSNIPSEDMNFKLPSKSLSPLNALNTTSETLDNSVFNNANNINSNITNNNNNNITDEVMEKFDSLGLDIDTSELLSDINFNSMSIMSVMMDSGQNLNLSLNSRENLLNSRDNVLVSSTLQTPQPLDQNEETNRNLMANPQQMQRLHSKLMLLESNNNNNSNTNAKNNSDNNRID